MLVLSLFLKSSDVSWLESQESSANFTFLKSNFVKLLFVILNLPINRLLNAAK